MNYNSLLCFINLDEVLNRKDILSDIFKNIDLECIKKEYYKGIIVPYSNKYYRSLKHIKESMYSLRKSDNILFGKFITRESDYYDHFFSDDNDAKKEIIKNIYRYYSRIIPIEEVFIIDNNISFKENEKEELIEVKKKIKTLINE